jgi:hypothetical protein
VGHHLEAVVLRRVVGAGDLDAAVHAEALDRPVEDRRGDRPDELDVDPARRSPPPRRPPGRRAGSVVVAHHHPGPPALHAVPQGVPNAADPGRRVTGQVFRDHAPDVVLPEDVLVHVMGFSTRCLQVRWPGPRRGPGPSRIGRPCVRVPATPGIMGARMSAGAVWAMSRNQAGKIPMRRTATAATTRTTPTPRDDHRRGRIVLRFPEPHVPRHAQVVVVRDQRRQHQNHRQLDAAPLDDGPQDGELAPEPAGGRHTRQGEQEDRHGDPHQRRPPSQAAVLRQPEPQLVLVGHHEDHGERAHGHERVDHQVVQERRHADHVGRRQRHQQVAGVGDAGVGQHPLHAVLRERHEVGRHHGGDGEPEHDQAPGLVQPAEARQEHPQERGERCRLHRRRHEGGHRRRAPS